MRFQIYVIKYFQKCLFSAKSRRKVSMRNKEELELKSGSRPTTMCLSMFGSTLCGALGIPKLINGERSSNVYFARKFYPLFFFRENNNYTSMSVKNVACGYGFSIFAGRNSKFGWQVFGCGLNNDSQLGMQSNKYCMSNDEFKIVLKPSKIDLPIKFKRINHIACGKAHTMLVGELETTTDINDQVVFSWGNNSFGQCGRQVIENEIYSDNSIINNVKFPKKIKQIVCGENSTYLLTEDGVIYSFGNNYYGQLGRDGNSFFSYEIEPILGKLENQIITQISCTSNICLALTQTGNIYGWGDNENNLIYSDKESSRVCEPTLLPIPNAVNTPVTNVVAGNFSCGIIDSLGQVFTWGRDTIGHGPEKKICLEPSLIPMGIFGCETNKASLNTIKQQVSKSHSKNGVIDLQMGPSLCSAITSNGSIYLWGYKCMYSKLSKNRELQTFPIRFGIGYNIKRVVMGADHLIAIGSTFV